MQMPRFFFHIHDDQGMSPDDEGMELPDAEAAKREAEASARDYLAGATVSDTMGDDRRIEVTDADGVHVATIKLRDLIN
jgi:hypothetical protein